MSSLESLSVLASPIGSFTTPESPWTRQGRTLVFVVWPGSGAAKKNTKGKYFVSISEGQILFLVVLLLSFRALDPVAVNTLLTMGHIEFQRVKWKY